MSTNQISPCPDSLRRLLDEDSEAVEYFTTGGILPPDPPRGFWSRLMTWTPSVDQVDELVDRLRRAGRILDCTLKVAVFASALYLLLEVGMAFLPGGAVDRIFGGVR